jgi:hypothetical protein
MCRVSTSKLFIYKSTEIFNSSVLTIENMSVYMLGYFLNVFFAKFLIPEVLKFRKKN